MCTGNILTKNWLLREVVPSISVPNLETHIVPAVNPLLQIDNDLSHISTTIVNDEALKTHLQWK